ncbi:MAG: hypothetical protein A2147_05710 [Chloroflexi bacterium RBG_16_57_8]|nr:MAG: hypothetical protein A2147_05710 [Chloroflexi bacterium RBG_16_57_8]
MAVERARVGLAAVEDVYQDYGRRARELKAAGKKIVGYLCALVPIEIITAAGMAPFRIKGDCGVPITRADASMETIVCGAVRSCFDLSLKRYGFLDGIVVPHACDSITRTYPLWQHELGLPYSHFLNLPHSTEDSSLVFFKAVLNTFKDSLARYAGRDISENALKEAVRLYNQNRTTVAELYELRKADPPLVSGTEVTKTLIAAMSLPVEESTRMIESVIAEVRLRPNPDADRLPRIMVFGAEVGDVTFIELVESTGAHVVADDLCPGARENLRLTDVATDPMDGLAQRYLRGIDCPRTYAEPKGTYPEYLERRFGDIARSVRDFRVDGVIVYLYRYCDPFGFEVPALKSYLDSLGVPVLSVENEYSMPAIGWLKNRVQAFLEMLEQGSA